MEGDRYQTIEEQLSKTSFEDAQDASAFESHDVGTVP